MDDPTRTSERQGAFADLIEVERGMLEAIEQARVDADRKVEAAEAELAAEAQDGDAALDDAVRALREALEAERRAALEAIEQRARDAAQRYRDVDAARIDALATRVARRVAEGDDAPGGRAASEPIR